jgi:hypothetical protein
MTVKIYVVFFRITAASNLVFTDVSEEPVTSIFKVKRD